MAKQVLVLGAGASGLMAGIQASRCGAEVTVLEHNQHSGRKLLATGNGRCNLTNLKMDSCFYQTENSLLVQKILQKFSLEDTLNFFGDLGLRFDIRDGWVYPASLQAGSVLHALLDEASRWKIKIKTLEEVRSVRKNGHRFLVETKSWHYEGDAVICSLGSPASQVEGSSDTMLALAKQMKLSAAAFSPALVSMRGEGSGYGAWAGVRVKASLTCETANGPLTESGELQLTDYGISGIPVFQLSGRLPAEAREHAGTEIRIDFYPALSEEQLTAWLSNRVKNAPWKSMCQHLTGILPDKLSKIFAEKKQQRVEETVNLIKHYPFRLKSYSGLKMAQVAAGGISLRELTEDLEAVSVKGLYFTGEGCDVTGRCGGYNLQWAWSSGAVAGMAAGREDL